MRIFPLHAVSLLVLVAVLAASTSPPTFLVRRSSQSARAPFAAATNLAYAVFHSSRESCMQSPLFSYPISNTVSPMPSSILSATRSCNFLRAPSSVASRRSLSGILGAVSARSRLSKSSSSSSWCSPASALVVASAPAVRLEVGKRRFCCCSTYSAKSLSAYAIVRCLIDKRSPSRIIPIRPCASRAAGLLLSW